MSGLYKRLHAANDFELKLLVAGAHLSPTFGRSIEQIRDDQLDILLTIETLLDADSRISRLKSASLLLTGAIDTVAQYDPDLILYAGDREEVIIGALLGAYLEIPTVHFFGGDHSRDGHVDHPVRHATSKLSTAHLVSLPEHEQRLLRMGEAPERVHCIGSIALDRFVEHQPAAEADALRQLGLDDAFHSYAVVIFHPLAEEKEHAAGYFEHILSALEEAKTPALVSAPNADQGHRDLLDVATRWRDRPGFFFYKNLPRALFLDIYKNARLLVGNSSSGIIEAASIPLPVVNVGMRQRGRLAGENVIFCNPDRAAIVQAIDEALGDSMAQRLTTLSNPYGDGRSIDRALRLLRELDLRALLPKREDVLDAVQADDKTRTFHGDLRY
ncbi:putative UDP-N-acetylglucosamine 2-epimerase [Magnetofaba australis IT-1]|uniref:Putative UDP-N-acetylglucosamine 2-epimerase n=2 Tax=Magnetofaba TaxID=1472292 RepID=A0A1Y2K1M0_9PROT|nr:putative UDP-N-acetylglucosamine 2-epimerase [Magnetofaba australis IT-1]